MDRETFLHRSEETIREAPPVERYVVNAGDKIFLHRVEEKEWGSGRVVTVERYVVNAGDEADPRWEVHERRRYGGRWLPVRAVERHRRRDDAVNAVRQWFDWTRQWAAAPAPIIQEPTPIGWPENATAALLAILLVPLLVTLLVFIL